MTWLIASVRPAHHPHKSGLSAECIWKQHVKLLRSGGAKSWAGSIRQRSSSGMSASTEDRSCVWLWPMQANLQSATCPGRRRRGCSAEGGCTLHNALARLLWSRCTARLLEEGREALCSTDPILCTCWTFPQQSSVQLPWKFPKTTYIFPPLQGFIKPLSALQHQEKKIHPFGRWQGPQCFDL